MPPTHEVLNQPPPLEGLDLFGSDRVLRDAVDREGAGWARERLHALGAIAGGDAMTWGRLANQYPPVLHTHDRYGHRIDEVEFHPAWHDLMRTAVAHEAARPCRGASHDPAPMPLAPRSSSCCRRPRRATAARSP